MVTDSLLSVLGGVLSWIAGLLPDWEAPADLDGAIATLGTAVGWAADLGNWFPWPVILGAGGLVMAALVIAVAIRLVRITASFLTLGGGSAA